MRYWFLLIHYKISSSFSLLFSGSLIMNPSRPKAIFVDVDDTLVRSIGQTRIPMPAVIAHIRRLHDAGHQLYLWSSGGADYARASAEELGIGQYFQAFLPKPQAYIDDQAVADWRFCRHILPANSSEIE